MVFVKYLEYSNEEAVKEAKQIKGWGPSVYMRKKDEWIRILGEGKGMAMYSMIYTLRKKGGSLSSENAGFVGIILVYCLWAIKGSFQAALVDPTTFIRIKIDL